MAQEIGVGINEALVIKSATKNAKKTLELEFEGQAKAAAPKVSIFERSLTAKPVEESYNMRLMLFAPLLPTKDDMTTEQKMKRVMDDLIKLRVQLTQILEQFIMADQIDLNNMDVQYANTGIIDGPTFEARILDQDVISRIYDNLTNRFITLITPFTGKPEDAVRLKLVRQSKDKHYATLPSRYIEDNPFIELMSVPKEQSRVKFTKYELDNKLNDGTPIAAGSAEAKPGTTATGTPVPLPVNPFAPQG